MKYKSRKFVVTLLIYGATVVLGSAGKIDGEQIYRLLLFVGGMYGSANLISKFLDTLGTSKEESK